MQKVILEQRFFSAKVFSATVRLVYYKATEKDIYFALETEEEKCGASQHVSDSFKTKTIKYYRGSAVAFQVYLNVCEYYDLLLEKDWLNDEVLKLKEKSKKYSKNRSIPKEFVDNV